MISWDKTNSLFLSHAVIKLETVFDSKDNNDTLYCIINTHFKDFTLKTFSSTKVVLSQLDKHFWKQIN